ncbi:hypothetical protein X777_05533 [Ooceraea biroi]|uniref:Uncharacterized protein n=1 Tax=Ooceraea biroi TaxID=2015173 RepID=A0A026WF20_OOCBI|nr:hypothetical protein X777_05533 [Ooceraea biroi]
MYDVPFKGSGENESIAKVESYLYSVRVTNEFFAECSLPEIFCNTRDISDIQQLFSIREIGLYFGINVQL